MRDYELGVVFLVHADDEQHAVEQFIELLHDNGDHPNYVRELED